MKADRHIVSACRNLVHEYESVLEFVLGELKAEEDAMPLVAKASIEEIAIQALTREAHKEGMTALINRIKHYGNQRPE